MDKHKILLVEDHSTWAQILLRKIQIAIQEFDQEVEVTSLASFDQAWRALDEDEWCLLITDIGMETGEPTSKPLGAYAVASGQVDETIAIHLEQVPPIIGVHLVERAFDQAIPCIVVSGNPKVTPQVVADLFENYKIRSFFWKPDFDGLNFLGSIRRSLLDCGKKSISQGRVSDLAFPEKANSASLEAWWQEVQEKHGHYSCYSFLLMLPGDEEIIEYLNGYGGKELDQLGGDAWFLIALNKGKYRRPGFERDWRSVIEEYLSAEFSRKVANYYKINFKYFPCLVLFQDINSPQHVIVNLKGRSITEIKYLLRTMAYIIHNTEDEREKLLEAIKDYKYWETQRKRGEWIVRWGRNLAGKTFEKGLEVLFKEITKGGGSSIV